MVAGDAAEHVCSASACSKDDYELFECEDCGELLAAKTGQLSHHTCPVTGTTSVAAPIHEDGSDSEYDPSSGGWGSVEDPSVEHRRESWEYDW